MRARANGVVGWWLALTVLSGCSWLVEPERDSAQCSLESGVDPCPRGSHCVNKRCAPYACAASEVCGNQIDDNCNGKVDEATDEPEVCDHLDNNCNGKIDEGHDADGDGVPWCDDNVNPKSADCDDLNPKVGPNATEVCDGVDNDCDDDTDEAVAGASLCAADKQCINGECVAPKCDASAPGTCPSNQTCVEGVCLAKACPAMACPTDSYCDTNGVCAPKQKRANGQACLRSDDCASGLCVDGATMRVSTERICVQACCDDSSCASNEVCIASGTGARSCMPKENYPTAPRYCTATCGGGESCVVAAPRTTSPLLPERASVCQAPIGWVDLGSVCILDSDCKSGVCVPGATTSILNRVCSKPCGSSKECAAFPIPITQGPTTDPAPRGAYCRYTKAGLFGDLLPTGDDWISICTLERGEISPAGTVGVACTSGQGCADGACVGATQNTRGKCAPTCCSDAQCKELGDPALRCLPIPRGVDVYEMRCIKG